MSHFRGSDGGECTGTGVPYEGVPVGEESLVERTDYGIHIDTYDRSLGEIVMALLREADTYTDHYVSSVSEYEYEDENVPAFEAAMLDLEGAEESTTEAMEAVRCADNYLKANGYWI